MNDDELRGRRRRYFQERKLSEANARSPLRSEVSADARRRLIRELGERLYRHAVDVASYAVWQEDADGYARSLAEKISRRLHIIGIEISPEGLSDFSYWQNAPIEIFLTYLEVATETLSQADTKNSQEHLNTLQSILADDASSFRFRIVRQENTEQLEIHELDNIHLNQEIVNKTFELTTAREFASAQHDYAQAWSNYSRGDLDGALVDAHKAFESAAKVIIKQLDPTCTPEQMQTRQLIPELKRLEIIPDRLGNVLSPLTQVFLNAGVLRNAPGAGHGSLDLTTPEAGVALLGLHLSGSLVFFLAQRWESMKPKS